MVPRQVFFKRKYQVPRCEIVRDYSRQRDLAPWERILECDYDEIEFKLGK
jgi:hypothetical protein